MENLAETRARVMRYWREQIEPRIRRGKRLLISTHGNTLRALIMELAGMCAAQVEQYEIPTATPIVYRFDTNAKPVDWQYLQTDTNRAA